MMTFFLLNLALPSVLDWLLYFWCDDFGLFLAFHLLGLLFIGDLGVASVLNLESLRPSLTNVTATRLLHLTHRFLDIVLVESWLAFGAG